MRFSNDRTIASPMWNFIYSINVDRSSLEIFMNSASFWRRDSSRMRNRIESTNFSRNSLRCENRESSRRACKMCRLVKEIFLLHMYASQQIASILFAKIRATISIKRSAIFSSRTTRRFLVAIFYRPWKTLKNWNVVETRTGRIIETLYVHIMKQKGSTVESKRANFCSHVTTISRRERIAGEWNEFRTIPGWKFLRSA